MTCQRGLQDGAAWRRGAKGDKRGMEAFFRLRNKGDERNWTNRTEYRHLFEYLKKLINFVYCRISKRVCNFERNSWYNKVLFFQRKKLHFKILRVRTDEVKLKLLNYLFDKRELRARNSGHLYIDSQWMAMY